MSTEAGTESESTQEVAVLLVKHRTALLGYLLAVVQDPQDAEDLIQEVSVLVLKKAGDYRPGTSFRAWAREIARFCILNLSKKKRPGTLPITPQLLERAERADRELGDGSPLEEECQAVRECLGLLGRLARRVIDLRYEEGLQVPDIARTVGRTLHATYAILKRSRLAVRRCMEEKLSTQ